MIRSIYSCDIVRKLYLIVRLGVQNVGIVPKLHPEVVIVFYRPEV